MTTLISRFAMLGLLAIAAMAADVAGKWKGSAPGRDGQPMEYNLELKADGAALSGTLATQMGSTPITDGKADGDNVSFKVKREFNGNAFVMNYAGKVDGDEMKLTMTVEGREMRREMTLKRAK